MGQQVLPTWSRVPQPKGTPGWLMFSHTDEGIAQCIFVDAKQESAVPIPIVMDERLCSDTILRAIRIRPRLFAVCDILVWNGDVLPPRLPFETRKERLRQALEVFHSPVLTALQLPEDVDATLHGYEYYDEKPGTTGVFLPA